MRNENYITFEEIPANLKKNSNDIIYQYKRYLSIINEPIKYNEKKEILFNLILNWISLLLSFFLLHYLFGFILS